MNIYIYILNIFYSQRNIMRWLQEEEQREITVLGSFWIELILLKLEIKNWKYCSKIIFKCVNSTVRPIFNKKSDWKLKFVGSLNSIWVYSSQENSQNLRLLFMNSAWTVAVIAQVPLKRGLKKKKRVKRKCKTQNVYPNPA